jgi:NitT/TauT family transport system permease protein
MSNRLRARSAAILLGVIGLLVLATIWQVYKLIGPEDGVQFGDSLILPRTSELAMPNVWEMITVLGDEAPGIDSPTIGQAVLAACLFTLRLAALAWGVGVVIGAGLAILMCRFRIAEQAALPWIILSQTVPLIAIAPLVRRWGSQIEIGEFEWSSELSVIVIAAYLAFFPVAVGLLRGLRSVQPAQLDLLRSYGVGWTRTLITVRFPASVPFLLSALRLAAASAVIGVVVAEVSIGLRGGIGRLVVEYAQSAGSSPAKPWAAIFGAVLVGLIAAGAVVLIGVLLRRYRRQELAG